MTWGQTIIALLVLFAVGFAILILLRLRARHIEDPDEPERVRSIKEGLGLRKPPREHSSHILAMLNAPAQVLAALAIAIGDLAL
jgi:hypothetical protein